MRQPAHANNAQMTSKRRMAISRQIPHVDPLLYSEKCLSECDAASPIVFIILYYNYISINSLVTRHGPSKIRMIESRLRTSITILTTTVIRSMAEEGSSVSFFVDCSPSLALLGSLLGSLSWMSAIQEREAKGGLSDRCPHQGDKEPKNNTFDDGPEP